MLKIRTLIFLICCVWLTSCKKDEVAVTNIHGSVYNLCTDQYMANIQVKLISQGPNAPETRIIHSDANGNFSFNNVSINMSNDYSYKLNIESKSGIGGGPEAGFDGVDVVVDKSNLNHVFKLGVIPHFKFWQLYFPNTQFTSADTFVLTYEQKTFHKNVPQNPNYKLTDSCPCPITSPTQYAGGFNNYWMGWWHVTYDKTTNGIHAIYADSFYVDWNESRTDTIPY